MALDRARPHMYTAAYGDTGHTYAHTHVAHTHAYLPPFLYILKKYLYNILTGPPLLLMLLLDLLPPRPADRFDGCESEPPGAGRLPVEFKLPLVLLPMLPMLPMLPPLLLLPLRLPVLR